MKQNRRMAGMSLQNNRLSVGGDVGITKMLLSKTIRITRKSHSANFTRLNHTPFVYSESRDGLSY
ncbi:hypothetical protein [Rubritalea tangerina]|uniref:hypothetical protein n=1 Tax=Rubritalea tangerina TaxID=430798 RepID=UPI00360F321A